MWVPVASPIWVVTLNILDDGKSCFYFKVLRILAIMIVCLALLECFLRLFEAKSGMLLNVHYFDHTILNINHTSWGRLYFDIFCTKLCFFKGRSTWLVNLVKSHS